MKSLQEKLSNITASSIFVYVGLWLVFATTRFLLNGVFKGWNPGLYHDAGLHYMSGVMVETYFAENWGTNPIVYLANFFEQYAFTGVGLWPPVFHFFEGIWIILFSGSRLSILALDAAIVGSTALSVFHVGKPYLRFGEAFFGALAICVMYQFLLALEILMIDAFTAFWMFWSVIHFIKFLNIPSLRNAIVASFMASIAILSKGTAIALVLVLPLATLLADKSHLLKNYRYWIIPIIIGVLTAPWYLLTSQYSSQGFRFEFGWDYTSLAFVEYSAYVFQNMGIIGMALLFFAVIIMFKEKIWTKDNNLFAGLAALCIGAFLYQILMPVALQDRYIIVLYPAMLLIAFKGLSCLHDLRLRKVLIFAGLINIFAFAFLTYEKHEESGEEAAQTIIEAMKGKGEPILLIASPEIEGVLATDIWMNAPKALLSDIYFLRGVKLLGGGGYNNLDYEVRYPDLDDVKQAIKQTGISFLVIEQSERTGIWEHNAQVAEIIAADKAMFVELATIEISENRSVRVIRVETRTEQVPDLELIKSINQNRVLTKFKGMFHQ
ncbi:glycosyltransferase family 39 protein [Kordiimonas sp. SCSIO 12603]|uniref:ArnT family glycosyltransferase n=1 Tax=Kordiimonas sp. SCSIO 12603 TaxID=2829596 RepID=UPI0021050A35|nr:glycosyltransferase family 39 protein [Kordiimonas sp. SCSIO 12603]UTW60370.1 glycosyltransferase family 39 protein [Kordiimonas sp. SCSIO 12603]